MQRFNRLWPFFDQFSTGYVAVKEYDPVWLRCLEAVHEAIVALDLEGVDTDSIIMLEFPLEDFFAKNEAAHTETKLPLPGIVVWPMNNETTDPAAGTNAEDEIKYPIGVSIVDRGIGSMPPGMSDEAKASRRATMRRHMLWREQISERFRHAAWPDLNESGEVVVGCYVEPKLYAIPEAYRLRDLYHGAVVVNFTAWQGRANQHA